MKFIAFALLISLSLDGFTAFSENFETLHASDAEAAVADNVITDIVDRFRDALNSAVIQLIESQRDNIATGWPPRIPPLDPFFIDEIALSPLEVAGFNSFEMTLNDTFVRGLQRYVVKDVDIRPLRLSARIALSFDKLELEGTHATRAEVLGGIFPMTFEGSGPFDMTFNNVEASLYVRLNFVNRRLNLQVLLVGLTVESATTNFQGFGPLTNVFNNLASVAFPPLVLVKVVELNLRINEEILPQINETLNEITILDVIAVIFDFITNNGLKSLNDVVQG